MMRITQLVLLLALCLLVSCYTPEKEKAERVAISFVSSFAERAPSDYREYLSGGPKEVKRKIYTVARGFNLDVTYEDAWKKLHLFFHDIGHPYTLYDPSWDVRSEIHQKGAAVTFLGEGERFDLFLKKTGGEWKVALDSSPGPFSL